MSGIRSFILALMLVLSGSVLASKTYISLETINIYKQINGEVVDKWPDKTLFTAKVDNEGWLTITGVFPEGVWQPLSPARYVLLSKQVKERVPYQEKAAKTVIYTKFEATEGNARAYKLRHETRAYFNQPIIDADTGELTTLEQFEIWPKDKIFTARYQNRHYIKVTGHFPDGNWQALEQPVWIMKPVKLQDRTQPKQYKREPEAKRFAVINKAKFELMIYEVNQGKTAKLLRTPVALGYDRCLPKEKGGKCYYTPEGQYQIEFKLFDPDGINWCVPPKMESEFQAKLAKGERCWRGVMGNHALHFGDSLFLHGTSNPDSIGSRTTHGCVRLRNPDIAMVYRLLKNGDTVLISEDPSQFDLVALASNSTTEINNEEKQ